MTSGQEEPRALGRYLLYREIASGGMASVHLGRLMGPVGFSKTVAIKRLHPQFERDPEFVAMFLDEARIAARVRHPNVVQILDVVATDGELFLVLDYVEGDSLRSLLRASGRAGNSAPPAKIVAAIVSGALQGLHAAHEAKGEGGEPLGVVHRDVSPDNILVGVDGIPRVLDFGIAKAMGRLHATRSGQMKGKLAYMAPEQITSGPITRRTDVYGASVVLWEALTGSRLFTGDEGAIIARVIGNDIPPPSSVEPSVPRGLDALTLRGLSKDPDARFPTAVEMAHELARVTPIASSLEVAEWVKNTAGEKIAERAAMVVAVESAPRSVSDLELPHPPTLVRGKPVAPAASQEAETRLTWRRALPRGMSPRAAAASGVGFALALALIAAVATLVLRAPPAGDPAGKSPSASPTPIITAAPPAPSPRQPVAPIPSRSVSASIPDASAPRPVKAPVVKRVPPKSPPKHDNCDPPFYFDKDGIKVFKPGCPL